MSQTVDTGYRLRYLGDTVLTTPCEPLASLDDLDTLLVKAMLAVCRGDLRALRDRRSGAGLAANQVGALVRVVLVQFPGEPAMRMLLNPALSGHSASTSWDTEGCLSIPGFETSVKRHDVVTVSYRDEEWAAQQLSVSGFTARVLQHEVDHLDGKLIINGASRQVRRQAERAVAKAWGV